MKDKRDDMTEDTMQPEFEQAEGGLFASKGKFIAAAAVLIGALGYLGFIAFQSATVYSYTVSELAEMGPTPDGKLVRVSGSLVDDSFVRPDGSTIAHFRLTDTDADAQNGALIIAANYEGVLPDLFFNPHSEIILEGNYGTDGIFHSQNVLVKCPSKYIEAGDESTGDYGNYEEPAT